MVRDLCEPVALNDEGIIGHFGPDGDQPSFVLAQAGEEFPADALCLACRIQPMLAVISRLCRIRQRPGCAANQIGLTGRELAVLALLREGKTACAIARQLRISPRTVHTHLSNIYRKAWRDGSICEQFLWPAQELGVTSDPRG